MPKTTIVMIHGFRGTHHGLELIAKNLNQYEVVIPDLPGFADGDELPGYDLDQYVLWLKKFIGRHNDRPILLGHSFGSIICAEYAKRYPKTIDKLILVNPIGAPALDGPRAILSKLALAYYQIGEKLPGSLAKNWLASKAVVQIMSSTMAKTKDKDLRKYIHQQHHTHFSKFHSPESLSQGFKTSIQNSVLDSAPYIKVPTLLVVGDKDDITPLEKQNALLQKFSQAKMAIITGVGHLTHYETPDQVADAVKDFITSS